MSSTSFHEVFVVEECHLLIQLIIQIILDCQYVFFFWGGVVLISVRVEFTTH